MSEHDNTVNDQRAARDKRQAALTDAIWDHAIEAIEANLPNAALTRCAEEDVHAVIESLVDRLDQAGLTVLSRERVANYLLTHAGGDESQPWQEGHNYAMTEAARLVREGWDANGDPA